MDFRDAAFSAVQDAMRRDASVMVATNDMGAMLLDEIRAEFPERVLNVGIAEQNLIGVAAGLAMAGRKMFVYGIASHVTSRCLEQIKLDLCVMDLPVVILGVGAGLSYGNDGPSHHGTEDVGILRPLPNMAVYNPCDWVSALALVAHAARLGKPAYVRLDREKPKPLSDRLDDAGAGLRLVRPGADLLVLATGVAVHRALDAASALHENNLSVAVADVYRLSPAPAVGLAKLLAEVPAPVCVVEEHAPRGGLHSLVAETMAASGLFRHVRHCCLPDEYLLGAADRAWAERRFGLDADGLARSFAQAVRNHVGA